VSFGRVDWVAFSLVLKVTPPEPLAINAQPSFTSPSDQFCTLVVTVTFCAPDDPAGRDPSAVVLWEPVPLAPAFVHACPALLLFQVTSASTQLSVT
jgi:hypothetical protein